MTRAPRPPLPKPSSGRSARAPRATPPAVPVPAAPAVTNHRTRTGAARREATRRKLLAAALQVFAEKGTEVPLIDDFIAAAGVARGTFYNYFSTTQQLLDAVTAELGDQLMHSIEQVVVLEPDPLQRLVRGCLMYMHFGVDLPNWGQFVNRTGMRRQATGPLADVYLPRDLAAAQAAGQLSFPSVRAARDLLLATAAQSVITVLAGEAPREHLRQTFALALRGLGLSAARAQALCAQALPTVPLPPGLGAVHDAA